VNLIEVNMLDVVLQQNFLEAIFLIAFAVAIIGIFWKIILIGGTFLLLAVIIVNHSPGVGVSPAVAKQPATQEVVVNKPQKEANARRSAYIRDCVGHGFGEQWCKDNWDDKLFDKEN
jgi:hypothetical protein